MDLLKLVITNFLLLGLLNKILFNLSYNFHNFELIYLNIQMS